MKRVALVTGAILLVACGGPTVEDVCQRLDEECGVDSADCLDDGDEVEQDAEQQGCEDGFEAYLECSHEASCDWAEQCADIRADLETCLGGPII